MRLNFRLVLIFIEKFFDVLNRLDTILLLRLIAVGVCPRRDWHARLHLREVATLVFVLLKHFGDHFLVCQIVRQAVQLWRISADKNRNK